MSEESRPVSQQELSRRPHNKEDEFFERQERERLEDLERQRRKKSLERKCPRCQNIILVPERHGDVEMDRCPECRGVWLDAGELEELTHPAKKDGAIMAFFKAVAGRD